MAVLDGRTIVEKGMVDPVDDDQVQPNGVDLRVASIQRVRGHYRVPKDGSVDFSAIQCKEVAWNNGWCVLEPGNNYVVSYRENVSVRDGYCAIIVARSSLLRGGSFVTSAIWDTGFGGGLGGVIRPLVKVEIERGARLAQIQFHEAKFNGHRYEGRYQGTTSQTALMT